MLPTIDQRYQVESINLMRVSPEQMTIEIDDDRVLALIRHWSVERVFSASQITIFNHKLNQLFAYARKLGFYGGSNLVRQYEATKIRYCKCSATRSIR